MTLPAQEPFTEGDVEINRHDCTDIYNINPDTGECRVCIQQNQV